MKKLFLLVAILTATMFSAKAVNLDPELKAALPSLSVFITANPYPNETNHPEIWQEDQDLYPVYKLPRLNANGDVNCDSIWAYKNEAYLSILLRLSADSVMNAPFVTISSVGTLCNGRPTNAVYSQNETDFSAMYKLEQLCDKMKSTNVPSSERTRLRPFVYYSDWYGSKKYSIENNNHVSNYTDSYPSGHGYFAGLFGACLRYIDPTNTEKIDKMLEEWLHCRLQRGAHWKSDITAGKQFGAMAYTNVIDVAQFRNALEAAKEELYQYRLKEYGIVPTHANADPNHAGVYYSTFYDKSRKYQLPDGVSAYVAELNTDNLLLTKIADAGQVIPADNAVILKANAANFTLAKTDDEPVSFSATNNLQGVDEDGVDTPENCYVLSGGSTGVGFYQYAGATLAPHKAFVVISGSGSFAPALNFVFYDEQTTTDNSVITSQNPNGEWMKIFRDGQIIIERNGTQYSTPGQIIQ